jgi:hypothetical protein
MFNKIIKLSFILVIGVVLFVLASNVVEGRHFYTQLLGYTVTLGIWSGAVGIIRSYNIRYPHPDDVN